MDIFTKRGASPETYYSQVNNAMESLLKKVNPSDWLETCGPTSAVTAVDAIGCNVDCLTPGGWKPQPEDVLTLYLNDPRNQSKLEKIQGGIVTTPGNRIAAYYGLAIPEVFGVACRVIWAFDFGRVKDAIDTNRAVMVCLRSPGHYVCIVGYNAETKDLIYHDPWPGNGWPKEYRGKPGAHRRMTPAQYGDNVKPLMVVVG
jgi:hypothetical protein